MLLHAVTEIIVTVLTWHYLCYFLLLCLLAFTVVTCYLKSLLLLYNCVNLLLQLLLFVYFCYRTVTMKLWEIEIYKTSKQ